MWSLVLGEELGLVTPFPEGTGTGAGPAGKDSSGDRPPWGTLALSVAPTETPSGFCRERSLAPEATGRADPGKYLMSMSHAGHSSSPPVCYRGNRRLALHSRPKPRPVSSQTKKATPGQPPSLRLQLPHPSLSLPSFHSRPKCCSPRLVSLMPAAMAQTNS